jgi:D-glycero-D-manno-heptose 1,7-bisphosphate phosphatase
MRPDYVRRWEDLEILPGVLQALARLTAAGLELIVLTNQSAIGRGLVTHETVDGINRRLAQVIEASGGRITAFLVCPHAPADGCGCRKPAPGLLWRARDELAVDLERAILVGDQPSDIEAARAAGCRAILIDPNGPRSLAEAADLILAER